MDKGGDMGSSAGNNSSDFVSLFAAARSLRAIVNNTHRFASYTSKSILAPENNSRAF